MRGFGVLGFWGFGEKPPSRADAEPLSDYMPLVVFSDRRADRLGAAGRAVPRRLQEPRIREAFALRMRLRPVRRRAHAVRRALLPGSLLFIIFDLEVAFLFPWAIVFHDLGGSASGR